MGIIVMVGSHLAVGFGLHSDVYDLNAVPISV